MEYSTDIRVRYAETDAMGIVHHASYVVWLEVGRTHMLRELGKAYPEWEAEGVFMSVGEVHLTYRAPLRFDDVVTLHTRVHEVGRRKVAFGYRLEKAGVRIAEGRTVHMVTGLDGRSRTLPATLLALLRESLAEDHCPGE